MGGLNLNVKPTNYYTYRFGDQDAVWASWTTNDFVTYENLRGGDYEFAFRVGNKFMESSDVKIINIHIERKFTETFGFPLLVIAALAGLMYLLFWYRYRRAMHESEIADQYQRQIVELKLNALQVQMNPHFIFNSINSINYYIIKNDRDKASSYLGKFSRLIRMILENSKVEFISLEQELEAIALYLEIEQMRFEGRFEFEMVIDEQVRLASIQIPPLIIQPYVENAIWHGLMHKEGKGHLAIYIDDNDGIVTCTIEDDGIGREVAAKLSRGKEKKKKSLGTKITKDRLDYIQQMYDIKTVVEIKDLINMDGSAAGTRVVIKIPKYNLVES